ncbi:MAG: hypothetical protein QXT19_04010 [Candidatus Woesearchaeota archaeon]
MAKAVCKCTPGGFVWMVIGVIVMALGVWAFVKGLGMQWSGSLDWIKVSFWYALGILVFCIGRMIKLKGCTNCPVHGI